QAETCALTRPLGREVRLEDAIEDAWLDASSGIADHDLDCSADRAGADRDQAALRHGVPRVDAKIENGEFELIGIGRDPRQIFRDNDVEKNVAAERAFEQLAHAAKACGDIYRLGFYGLPAGKSQQLPRQPGAARNSLIHRVHGFFAPPRIV